MKLTGSVCGENVIDMGYKHGGPNLKKTRWNQVRSLNVGRHVDLAQFVNVNIQQEQSYKYHKSKVVYKCMW